MPELRRDPVVGRWVIISTERARRPSDFTPAPAASARAGPACSAAGEEPRTPEEVWALRPGRRRAQHARAGSCAWCPTSSPRSASRASWSRPAEGLYDRMNGVGAHEVVIESPDHDAVIERLPPAHLAEVFRAYRDRIVDLSKDPRLEYVMVFKNHGDPAGASLEHTAFAAHRHADRAASWSRRSWRGRAPAPADQAALHLVRHHPAGAPGGRRVILDRWLRGARAVRATFSVRDLDPADRAPVALRGHAAGRLRPGWPPAVRKVLGRMGQSWTIPRTTSCSTARPCGRRRSITSTGISRSSPS